MNDLYEILSPEKKHSKGIYFIFRMCLLCFTEKNFGSIK
ncbi:hypothetical protein LEP1GSC086_1026 [Leptospira weilii str. LNT 1234]|nr:hypothetical protein LEP1GSC086_1026 [Leptospira weilii str. LNT 1234]